MNETEKQFFETFEINKSTLCKYAAYGYEGEQGIWYKCAKRDEECWTYPNSSTTCEDREIDYPQITDSTLLELICTLGSIFISVQDKETLKDHILNQCIMNKDAIKQQVQALFKENN